VNLIAHPTRYGGVLYRSRLEARWAAFFDFLGWPHVYEPLDLKGYIPDFILTFPYAPILVEVKPELYLKDLARHEAKIRLSGWGEEALVVGAVLFPRTGDYFGTVIGIIGEHWDEPGNEQFNFDSAPLIVCDGLTDDDFKKAENDPNWTGYPNHSHYSFRSESGSWRCRLCGTYRGDHHFKRDDDVETMRLWNLASEKTQWHPAGR